MDERVRRIVKDYEQEEAVEMLLEYEFCVSKAEAKRVYVQIRGRGDQSTTYWVDQYQGAHNELIDLKKQMKLMQNCGNCGVDDGQTCRICTRNEDRDKEHDIKDRWERRYP